MNTLLVKQYFLSSVRYCLLGLLFSIAPYSLAQETMPSDPNQTTVTEQTLLTETPATSPTDKERLSSHNLSPWGMYLNADIVVKIVMIGLLLASLLTWTIFVAKMIELLAAKKQLRQEMAELKPSRSLEQAVKVIGKFPTNSLSSRLILDAKEELSLSLHNSNKEGIKERTAFRQDRLVAESGRAMNKGTGILATIGSVSPFIGLFGTVWGIMNSFIGIAKSQTTNLAVVAPGIAEALLATALGLVAAIPAVIIYNVFVRAIAHYKVLVSDISAHTLLLVSRDLDHLPPTASSTTLSLQSVG